jgi:hypothetical protein
VAGLFVVSSPWVWLLHVRFETRYVHAERHLAKAGVARRKGRGISHPWSRGEAGTERTKRRKVRTSAVRRLGKPPCAARSGQSLSEARLPFGVRQHAWISGSALPAGTGPLRFSLAFQGFRFLYKGLRRRYFSFWCQEAGRVDGLRKSGLVVHR